MILSYHGGGCYKVQHGSTTIAVNPPSKDSKQFKISKFGADVALISLRHQDWNGIEQATHGTTVPFEIVGPGEYEYKEIFLEDYIRDQPTRQKRVKREQIPFIHLLLMAFQFVSWAH